MAKDDPAGEDWAAEHVLIVLRGRSIDVAAPYQVRPMRAGWTDDLIA